MKTPKYKKLKVNDIRMPSCSILPNEKKITSIVENFDVNLFGIPEVCFMDNEYVVKDGQHRLCALKKLGVNEVICSVV